ncbi:hypothetical protein JCM11641_007190 [Rhodosporidiobolus odoratus]
MADVTPHISIPLGITIGLAASFVQSLGLTIQRLSHVANERLPQAERKRDWKRPMWLTGFAIFILSNVSGTLFQIGALPIVVLGPLGAVSLLWNALFAKVILRDDFSVHLVAGTVLIAGGAVLIGIFGGWSLPSLSLYTECSPTPLPSVVPEQTHTLPELVALYRRAPFVLFVSLLFTAVFLVLAAAHFAGWRMSRTLSYLPPGTPRSPRLLRKRRRWSSLEEEERAARGFELNGRTPANEEERHDGEWTDSPESQQPETFGRKTRSYGATERTASGTDERLPLLLASRDRQTRFKPPNPANSGRKRTPSRDLENTTPSDYEPTEALLAGFESVRLWQAVAYGATSGTLSGLCLLFTKTGIELLILTLVGKGNQFGHIETWIIIIVLLVCELFQLSYLNRALRLANPTLICPLAFCFYNTTSIVSGLIYYQQTDALSRLQGAMVGLGCVVLLAGVWIVSVTTGKGAKSEREEEDKAGELELETDAGGSDVEDEDEEEPLLYRPRGFSIGLGAASPGFEIRPAHLHHHHHHHHSQPHVLHQSQTASADYALPFPGHPTETTPLAAPTTSLPGSPGGVTGAGGGKRRDRGHGRNNSLSGAPYVGLRRRTLSGSEVLSPSSLVGGEEQLEGVEGPRQGKGGRWWKRLRMARET